MDDDDAMGPIPMTPDRYFMLIASPNFWAFKESPGDICKAFNAAISLYHVADHYFSYYKVNDPSRVPGKRSDFIARTQNKRKEFKLVREVCNAAKHLYEDKNNPRELVGSPGAVYRVSVDKLDLEGVHPAEEQSGKIVCRTIAGENQELFPAFEAVYDMWNEMLKGGNSDSAGEGGGAVGGHG